MYNHLPSEISDYAELTPPRSLLLTEGDTVKHSKKNVCLVLKTCHTQDTIEMTEGESAKSLQTLSLLACWLPCGCFP